jgi:hypothetical protein
MQPSAGFGLQPVADIGRGRPLESGGWIDEMVGKPARHPKRKGRVPSDSALSIKERRMRATPSPAFIASNAPLPPLKTGLRQASTFVAPAAASHSVQSFGSTSWISWNSASMSGTVAVGLAARNGRPISFRKRRVACE